MMRNKAGWASGLGVVLLALGCSGTEILGDAAGGSGGVKQGAVGTASGGGSTSTNEICETQCVQDIFTVQPVLCRLCHTAPPGLESSRLDLASPNFTARLRDVPAKHGDLSQGMSPANCPTGDKLIDTTNPSASWLLKKLRGQQGNCGTPMPSTGMLTTDQLNCLQTYVYCVAGPEPK